MNLKIALASDHAGFEMKNALKSYLEEKGYKVVDFGTYSPESCDYPDFAHPAAEAVENKEVDFGIVMCGSGNGINMTVNKHQKIRGALCWNTELAELARLHNNANILSLPARFIAVEEAKKCVDVFLTTEFEGGRHQRRIDKIPLKNPCLD
ncbi:MAG TPA: ribose 5-phosphate isomerase B [Flavobacteriales bacterium]|nr:ribose 5-phosphate isomerase B [Flavobacteriales bacterium]|tara:strand:- start:115566 stop:116018 length:453 start_codon:yes stop_codon:yes gene_type:complete